jgi:hypothetical protein
MRAIWQTLAARGMSYVNITTTSSNESGVYTQYVRFLDQSIQQQSANCVDGSVLLASIFQKIGLHPVLIVIPGHCFVGITSTATGGSIYCLETTLLHSATFEAAIAYGATEYQAALPNFGRVPGYSVVDISELRAKGVMPITHP